MCDCPLNHPPSLEKVQQPSRQFINRHERGHEHLFDRVCLSVLMSGQLTPSSENPTPPCAAAALKAVYLSTDLLLHWAATCCCHSNRQPPPQPLHPHSPPFLRGKWIEMSLLLDSRKYTCAALWRCCLTQWEQRLETTRLKTRTCERRAQTGTWCIECLQAVTKERHSFLLLSETSCQTCQTLLNFTSQVNGPHLDEYDF